MRVAALYDIHGNLPALEAVVTDVRGVGVDLIVVGGDVYPGPMCEESLDYLCALDVPVRFITGNGDRETLSLAAGRQPLDVPESYLPAMRWVAEQLSDEHRETLASWPGTLRVGIDGLGEVLFCHGTPGSDTKVVTRLTPERDLLADFGDTDAVTVVCGHTHMQFDRVAGATRVVNAGSVGMPFGAPGAYWLLLGPDVELRKTSYDYKVACERVLLTSYPQRDEAARAIVAPPTEQAMLRVFSPDA